MHRVSPVPFSYLAAAVPRAIGVLATDPLVAGIALDSRHVQPGDLFVALPGISTDGHAFIPQAIQRGAVAVAGTQPRSGLPVPYLQVADSREALAYLSAAFYGHPARRLIVIGVVSFWA